MAALLLATVYGPLFHLHADDGEAPLIHAHFPEFEHSEIENGVHMEKPDPHALARSVDVLTTVAAQLTHFDAAAPAAYATFAEPRPCRGVVSATAARAHAPPAFDSRIPRAPPV